MKQLINKILNSDEAFDVLDTEKMNFLYGILEKEREDSTHLNFLETELSEIYNTIPLLDFLAILKEKIEQSNTLLIDEDLMKWNSYTQEELFLDFQGLVVKLHNELNSFFFDFLAEKDKETTTTLLNNCLKVEEPTVKEIHTLENLYKFCKEHIYLAEENIEEKVLQEIKNKLNYIIRGEGIDGN